MSETSEPTPDGSTSADDGSSSNTTATSTTSPTLKSSISTTSGYPPGPGMKAGTGVGVAIGVGLLLIGCVLVLYYLHRTGRLKWFKARGRPRRSSTSSSRRPLEPDDTESVDAMPRVTDGDMFAIADDHDHDHEREQAEDGYFYDEVFGSSAFEDETTKASNKELFSVSSDEVPDLLLRVDPVNFK